MLTQAVKGRSPANNPDSILVTVGFAGNYGVLGTGDALNLTPVSGANPGGLTDPNALGVPLPDRPLTLPPAVKSENIGGYYVQPTLGSTLQNCTLRIYAPGGGELASNSAYPAALLTGSVLLQIYLPQEQA